MRSFRLLLTAALAALPLGCGDSFGPLQRPVPEEPTEATLFDFRTGDLRDPSAFDMIFATAARPDQTSGWDFLFLVTQDGRRQFRPRGFVIGEETDAGLQEMDRSFEEVREAPEEGYETESPVEFEVGDVFAMQSRQDPGRGFACRRYGKMEVLSVDGARGTVTFLHLLNPNCENRTLVPGAGGDQ